MSYVCNKMSAWTAQNNPANVYYLALKDVDGSEALYLYEPSENRHTLMCGRIILRSEKTFPAEWVDVAARDADDALTKAVAEREDLNRMRQYAYSGGWSARMGRISTDTAQALRTVARRTELLELLAYLIAARSPSLGLINAPTKAGSLTVMYVPESRARYYGAFTR